MKNIICGVLFVAGICLAGSDSPWFPIVNFIGVFLFILFVILATAELPEKGLYIKNRPHTTLRLQ